MSKPTIAEIESKVRELASENPDFRYTPHNGSCYYTRGPEGEEGPGCIVGQALLAAGVDFDVLREFDDSAKASGIRFVARALADQGKIVMPNFHDAEWLNTVQRDQDKGLTWSEAVVNADTEVSPWISLL